MALVEALLAIVGLAVLVLFGLLLINVLGEQPADVPPTQDAATPYREGLHAAIRMQRVAQDLEQQIYAEAAQHIDTEPESSNPQTRELL